MDTITFQGTFIRYCDLRIKEEAGTFARLHLTSSWSDITAQAMEWETVPDCVDSAKLEGVLTAQSLILTPNQKELRQHEIQIECSEVSDFKIVRIKDGDKVKTELRFIARTVQAGAIALLENYVRTVGQSEGALKISYVTQLKLEVTPKSA